MEPNVEGLLLSLSFSNLQLFTNNPESYLDWRLVGQMPAYEEMGAALL
jgi:hypothetical protein